MPLNSSNSGKNVTSNAQYNKKVNKRTLDNSKDPDTNISPKKKFVTISDQNLMNEDDSLHEEGFNQNLLSDPNFIQDRKLNGKESDKSSLKVTIRRMSQSNRSQANAVNENFDLTNHQYQCENPSQHDLKTKDASVSTSSSATFTEPDLLGPCEPGTKIVLDATVWLETPGMLVVNANWRGKCYLGTLIDVSKSSLGPNIPDKSISALSFMRNRAWRGSIPKTRGFPKNANRITDLQRDLFENSNKAGITTRSAKAAAMAAANKNQDSQGISSESEMSTSSSVTTSNKRLLEDNDSKSGQKRRSKRSRNIKNPLLPNEKNNNDESQKTDTGQSNSIQNNNNNHETTNNYEEEKHVDDPIPKTVFPCPHDNCNKEFPSQISLRFHLQLGHTIAKKDIVCKSLLRKKKSTKLKEYEFDENDAPPQLQEEIPIEEPKDLSFYEKHNGKNDKTVLSNYENKSDYIPMPTASPAYSDISEDDLQDNNGLIENGNSKRSSNECNRLNKSEVEIDIPLSKQQFTSNNFPKNLASLGQFSKLHLDNQISNQKKNDPSFISNHTNPIAQFTFDTLSKNSSSQ